MGTIAYRWKPGPPLISWKADMEFICPRSMGPIETMRKPAETPAYFVWASDPDAGWPYRVYSATRYCRPKGNIIWEGDDFAEAREVARRENARRKGLPIRRRPAPIALW